MLDHLGVPYELSVGPEFDLGSCRRIEPFVAPEDTVEHALAGATSQVARARARGQVPVYGLPHFSQVVLAKLWARGVAGFDRVVFEFTSAEGVSDLFFDPVSDSHVEVQR